MSSLGKAKFSDNGHSQLQQLCHVIQSDMLTAYHFLALLFLLYNFLFQLCINLSSYLIYNRAQFLCTFCFPVCLLLQMPHPVMWPFYFQGSGLIWSVRGSWSDSICKAQTALQKLQADAMMLYRMAFGYIGRWLPCMWITTLLKLIYVVKVVQFPLSFWTVHPGHWVWLTSAVLLLLQHTFLPILMWRLIICHGDGCFQSGTLFLTFPKMLFNLWVY